MGDYPWETRVAPLPPLSSNSKYLNSDGKWVVGSMHKKGDSVLAPTSLEKISLAVERVIFCITYHL